MGGRRRALDLEIPRPDAPMMGRRMVLGKIVGMVVGATFPMN